MQAVSLSEHGPPSVLELQTKEDPEASPGQVLVELRAAALNRRDTLLRAGIGPAYRFPLPFVLGSDGAGVRRDTDEDVLILPSLDWGASAHVAGPDFTILGGPGDGTYAELVAVPEENVFPRPRGLSWEQAAALPLAGVTAQRALFAVGGLRSGESVLILGAGGGVALFALQLAVLASATVTVVSSSSEKLERARGLGAAHGIERSDPGWVEEVRARSGGVDLVLDSVGATWPQSLSCLAPGGRVVSCGATAGEQVELNVRTFYLNQLSLLGTKMGSPADFQALLRAVDEGGLEPVVDSVEPLDRAAAAHARMESEDHFGKLVLRVG